MSSKNISETAKLEKKHVDTVVVYTDGSFIKSKGKSDAKCGYGVYFPNKELSNISKKFTKAPLTNQRAELYAIYKAIKKTTKKINFNKMEIYTDSEYSIKSLTEWIVSWKKNGWKTTGNKEVSNQDIIKKIDKKLQKYKGKIIFTHVRSHTGKTDKHSLGNEQADKLATTGATS
jgi:ribonuclease HI